MAEAAVDRAVRGIDTLRAAVAGEVVVKDDPGYQAVSGTLLVPGRPAVVVRCAGPADVAAALGYAEAHALPVAVRSGGHNMAGFGTNDDGLVIDVSPMNDITIPAPDSAAMLGAESEVAPGVAKVSEVAQVGPDGVAKVRPREVAQVGPGGVAGVGAGEAAPGAGELVGGVVVRVGSGATWGKVAERLGEVGLAVSSGDTAGVGVGGLLAGGGIGWMVRKDGLAIDNVVAAEVVTADGSVHRVDAATEPELFWGVRGAAGSFGVVTSYDVVAVHQPTVYFGTLLFPWTQADQVLAGWTEYLATAPDELTSTLQLAPTMMADRQVPVAVAVCVAADAARTDELLAPLRSLGTLLTDTVAEVPYAQVLSDEGMPAGWTPRVRNGLFDAWSTELGERLMEARARIPALALEIRSLGGAFAAMPADATAFAHRGASFMVNSMLIGSTEMHGSQIADFEDLWADLRPERAYGNFLSHPTADDLNRCYPEPHRSRLAALKRAVDPYDVFHNALSITPA